jgi:hypothetical protein
MTLFRRSLLASIVFLAFASHGVFAQSQQKANQQFATATSPDRLFQVRYPNSLALCTHRDGENPDVWFPDVCIADIPVCDNAGHAGEVMMCLAYPPGEFKKSELQAAAFAVSRIDNLRTAIECMQNWPRRNTSHIRSERIGGVKFEAADAEESGNNHVNSETIYRTFHGGICYELDVNLAIAQQTAFAAEDAPRKLTSAEREQVRSTLMQALAGFRFLK